MRPITCIDSKPTETADHCAVTYGYGVLLPVFNQLGYTFSNISYCNCTEWDTYDRDQKYNCNLFNFLTGFVFWNDAIQSPEPLFELTNLSSSYINRKVYYSLTHSLTHSCLLSLDLRRMMPNISLVNFITAAKSIPEIILIFAIQAPAVTVLY